MKELTDRLNELKEQGKDLKKVDLANETNALYLAGQHKNLMSKHEIQDEVLIKKAYAHGIEYNISPENIKKEYRRPEIKKEYFKEESILV